MRTLLVTAILVATAFPLAAQQPASGEVRVGRGGEIPAGWTIRLDRPTGNLAEARFSRMGEGYHVTSGPSAIYYHADHQLRGDFTVEAELTQTRAPQHPEAYGIFIGGQQLETPQQRYTYFIVRNDGRYMIRHRAGSEVHDIAPWTEHAAVRAQGEDGRATNRLTIRAAGDDVIFSVNGTEIARHPRAKVMDVDGQAGLRVNHNLDVHIEGFRAGR